MSQKHFRRKNQCYCSEKCIIYAFIQNQCIFIFIRCKIVLSYACIILCLQRKKLLQKYVARLVENLHKHKSHLSTKGTKLTLTTLKQISDCLAFQLSLEITDFPPPFSTKLVAQLAMHWALKLGNQGLIPLAVSFLHHVFLPKVL